MRAMIPRPSHGPAIAACLLMAGFCIGCGDRPRAAVELNRVYGKVLLDGKPLPNASVVFTPKSGGRSTYATTNAGGKYELEYSTNSSGTPAGEYIVSIKTGRLDEEDPNTGVPLPATPELVPAVYNIKSTLTVKVPGSAETYSFDLKSEASEIVQPEPEPK